MELTMDDTLTSVGAMREAVFILGICQRSGTNYLRDLLVLHPECSGVEGIWEDFLLGGADHILEFADSVSARWRPDWDPGGRHKKRLLSQLTLAWVSFLNGLVSTQDNERPTRYLVTKTPSVRNLELVPMIPHAKVIVLIRDGRDVVASAMKSFDRGIHPASKTFADGARTILAAQGRNVPFLTVRYEDLVNNLGGELVRIFTYLDLDANRYDFDLAENMGVRGSSSFGRSPSGVHWHAVDKTPAFSPLGRWSDWTRSQHEQFNWLAGKENTLLGYKVSHRGRRSPPWRRLYYLLSYAAKEVLPIISTPLRSLRVPSRRTT